MRPGFIQRRSRRKRPGRIKTPISHGSKKNRRWIINRGRYRCRDRGRTHRGYINYDGDYDNDSAAYPQMQTALCSMIPPRRALPQRSQRKAKANKMTLNNFSSATLRVTGVISGSSEITSTGVILSFLKLRPRR